MSEKTKKLYGRENQLKTLIDTFERITSSNDEQLRAEAGRKMPEVSSETESRLVSVRRPELTLITGPSGTGKTALARALADYAQLRGTAYFIGGKFDQIKRLDQGNFYAFKDALDDLFKQIVVTEPHHVVRELANELFSRLSADSLLLKNSIPSLYTLLVQASASEGSDGSTVADGSLHSCDFSASTLEGVPSSNLAATGGDERFRFVIRNILQIVCSYDRPIVLLIDDWQWADEASLRLVEELLVDVFIQGLMILGACRGNEVDFDDTLALMLRRLEDENICKVVDVQVSSLDLKDIIAIMNDTLRSLDVWANMNISSEMRNELAKFIQNHTKGNAFGTKQMIQFLAKALPQIDQKADRGVLDQLDHLMDEKLLSAGCAIDEVDNLVSLVLLRLVDLPQDAQNLMKTCSCLGKDFSATVVAAGLRLDSDKVESALAHMESLELLVKRQERFHFVHDKIQEASYKMIPSESRPSTHVTIGRNLKQSMEEGVIPVDAPLLVSQFCRGTHLFVDETDRVILAALCLQAARSTHNSSSIGACREYLEVGLSLLPRRHWRDHYALSLDLKCSAAEMYYATGKFEKTAEIVEEVVGESRTEADAARAESILIFSLGSQSLIVEAMDQSLNTLKQLSHPVPSRVGVLKMLLEARNTSNALHGVQDSDILALPRMTDPKKLVALNIMNIVFLYNFSSRPPAAAVIAMRMVRLTLEHGLSEVGAIGFAAYGMILSNGFKDMENGARFGKLALKMYGGMSAKSEWYCRVHVLVWACLLPAHFPIRECTPNMRKAGISGLAAGDIEFAMLGVVLYTAYSIISARPLGSLFKEALEFLERMKLHRQTLIILWHLPLLQVMSTLVGDTQTNDPAVLTGKYMNEKEVMDAAFLQKNVSTLTVVNYNKLTAAVAMGDWKAAEQICLDWENHCDFSTIMVPVQDYARFMMAMASLVRVRSVTQGKRRLRRRARRYLNVLRERLKISEANYRHRVVLLEAEQAMGENQMEVAEEKYRSAAELSGDQCFWMEQGIAFERLAVCLSHGQQNFSDESIEQLQNAVEAYNAWGAEAKVKQLQLLIADRIEHNTSAR